MKKFGTPVGAVPGRANEKFPVVDVLKGVVAVAPVAGARGAGAGLAGVVAGFVAGLVAGLVEVFGGVLLPVEVGEVVEGCCAGR